MPAAGMQRGGGGGGGDGVGMFDRSPALAC